MEEGANLFYPESHKEMFWAEQFATENGQHMYIGFRGYDEITKTIINMDYSENTGIRHTTRKIAIFNDAWHLQLKTGCLIFIK